MIVRERPVPPAVALPGARTAFVPVAWLLAGSALAELVLARVFYRVGIFIPKEGGFQVVYRILTWVGVFAFNLASVLVLVALLLLAHSAFRGGRRSAGYILAAFVGVSILGISVPSAALELTVRILHLVAVLATGGLFLRGRAPGRLRLLVGGVVAAVAASAYAGVVADATRLAGGPGSPGASGAQVLGEAVVVATGLLAGLAWAAGARPRPAPLLAGLAAGAALLVAWEANGAVTGILVLWTAGLRLFLPVWLYALALAGMVAAATGWLPTAPWRSVGLLLLLPAGLLLDSTYQQALVLLGVVLLSEGHAVGGLPGWAWEPDGRARGLADTD